MKPGDSVVVMGDGTIGLILIQVACAYNAGPVNLLGKHEKKLEIAQEFGVSIPLNAFPEDPFS